MYATYGYSIFFTSALPEFPSLVGDSSPLFEKEGGAGGGVGAVALLCASQGNHFLACDVVSPCARALGIRVPSFFFDRCRSYLFL